MMTLSEIAHAVGGRLVGADNQCVGVVTDTRAAVKDALFVAIRGARLDGHEFLGEAYRKGATGALGAREPRAGEPATVVVDDTRQALGRLAGYWRHKQTAKVIAITGSNGKTSVKEMTASILATTGSGIATDGNLNNDIGMPLTLLRLRAAHRYAVIEIGMNRRGEIEALTTIADPDIALVTNAGAAHLAGLGSVEAVAVEKGQIYRRLRDQGVAIINADESYSTYWRGLWAGSAVTFGLTSPADITASLQLTATGSDIIIRARSWLQPLPVRLAVLGRHNVANALAATAVAVAYGVPPEAIARGLQAMRPVHSRLEGRDGPHGARIIDDSYNANPDSVRAAIGVLGGIAGERWLVLGDMAELGDEAPRLHAGLGAEAVAAGIEHVWTLGTLSAAASNAAGRRGYHYTDRTVLIEHLRRAMHPEAVVVIKGSRCMHMEQVVQELCEEDWRHAPVVM
ncbi:MAG: UDP-N-acetylmuramoyl-tripeptide--D-alanyl-D-alanine ligase [Acidiferrobacter sp.]